jgi:hypothetical protein
MTEKEAFNTIVNNASPYITLSYVLDDKGNLLAHFNFHPQFDEMTIELDVVSGDGEEILLSAGDVRNFGKKLIKFANAAEKVVEKYNG